MNLAENCCRLLLLERDELRVPLVLGVEVWKLLRPRR